MNVHTPARPRPLRLRDVKKRQTHDRTLIAARHIFIKRGYEAATLRVIADHMHMSTGAMFTTFASKEQLLAEVCLAEHQAYEAASLEYLKDRARLDRWETGPWIAYVLGIDEDPERLALLRCEAEVSWRRTTETALLSNRRNFILDFMWQQGGQDPIINEYFRYAWPLHLELCRTGGKISSLGKLIDIIKPAIVAQFD